MLKLKEQHNTQEIIEATCMNAIEVHGPRASRKAISTLASSMPLDRPTLVAAFCGTKSPNNKMPKNIMNFATTIAVKGLIKLMASPAAPTSVHLDPLLFGIPVLDGGVVEGGV